jgi:hypothetical protein
MARPKNLDDGLKKAAALRSREAIARVKAYEKWLKSGSDFKKMPEVPSDNDYKLARAKGAVNR